MHKHAVKEYQEETITSHTTPESREPLIVDLLMRCIQGFQDSQTKRKNLLTKLKISVSNNGKSPAYISSLTEITEILLRCKPVMSNLSIK